MLTVISPAKRLDWSARDHVMTTPVFSDDAARLAGHARQLTLAKLKSLMALSDDLARLNRDRFRSFEDSPAPDALRPAAFAFAGDTYQGLEAATLDADALRWAQDRLRILSGLYGVLRPLDGIQPYRLEMGSRLKTRRGTTLYAYWGDRLARHLTAEAEAMGATALLNCASQEYFGAVDPQALGLDVITPVFLEGDGDAAKIVSFYAKRARGALARFVVEHRITDPDALRGFDAGGYAYDAARSTPERPVFRRAAGQQSAA